MKQIYHYEALEALVIKLGFLPFFRNEIPGFSVEEYTPSERWFSDENEGPWEWKGAVARNGNCAYGKLFRGRAGFVSMDWFPELVNYRRSRYKPDADYENKPVRSMGRFIYDTVVEHESLLSKEIKVLCGYKKQRKKLSDLVGKPELGAAFDDDNYKTEGFETAMTRLQMGTWLIAVDFEYQYDKHQQPYGWGIARYTTPEALFGESRIRTCGNHSPEESKQRLTGYLSDLLPQATPSQILRLIE